MRAPDAARPRAPFQLTVQQLGQNRPGVRYKPEEAKEPSPHIDLPVDPLHITGADGYKTRFISRIVFWVRIGTTITPPSLSRITRTLAP